MRFSISDTNVISSFYVVKLFLLHLAPLVNSQLTTHEYVGCYSWIAVLQTFHQTDIHTCSEKCKDFIMIAMKSKDECICTERVGQSLPSEHCDEVCLGVGPCGGFNYFAVYSKKDITDCCSTHVGDFWRNNLTIISETLVSPNETFQTCLKMCQEDGAVYFNIYVCWMSKTQRNVKQCQECSAEHHDNYASVMSVNFQLQFSQRFSAYSHCEREKLNLTHCDEQKCKEDCALNNGDCPSDMTCFEAKFARSLIIVECQCGVDQQLSDGKKCIANIHEEILINIAAHKKVIVNKAELESNYELCGEWNGKLYGFGYPMEVKCKDNVIGRYVIILSTPVVTKLAHFSLDEAEVYGYGL
ncbi:hypothetical protein HELRODRAFT_177811 [Helobdella robusta]|uniref:WSC domain-containing protein n=1 Tax=Helobdella robusta TaxID=6412 RepID=T1FCA9_HELRO|nr:hypothetical protein HELRODRAFT_177811 [Helobdella robusta]ESN97749.1 hypothetical protein HELRODRAFT_177811 [Helobdella robusta]